MIRANNAARSFVDLIKFDAASFEPSPFAAGAFSCSPTPDISSATVTPK
nr:MAG TPA: hypothetical protein [Siphoviridae sp. ctqcj14]